MMVVGLVAAMVGCRQFAWWAVADVQERQMVFLYNETKKHGSELGFVRLRNIK